VLIQILDAQDIPHWTAWVGLDQINDWSGSLGAGAVGADAVFQIIIPAQTTQTRSGFLFQNTSATAMLLCELAAPLIDSSWVVNPGEFFPPPGAPFPVVTGAIAVMGTGQSQAGDAFACREFVNAPGE